MGLFSSLFGSKAPATTTQKNTVELSPEQKKLFNLALPSINQAAGQDPQIYGGSGIAGFNPVEQQAQQSLLNTAGGTVSNLAGSGANAQQFMLDPSMMLDPAKNPYVTAYGDTITRQMTDNLQRQILPGLQRQSAVTQGPYGATSRLGIAQGNAIGQTGQATGDALTKLYSGAYGQGLDAMGAAVGRNPATIGSQLIGGEVASAVGGQQRAMDQALLDEEISKFYLQQQLPFLKAQDIMSLMGSMPGGAGVSTVTGAQPSSNKGLSALGGAAAGMSAFGPIGAGIGGLLGLFG